MKMKSRIRGELWQYIYTLFFILIIFSMGIWICSNSLSVIAAQLRVFQVSNAKTRILALEKTIDTSLRAKSMMIDLYGLTQRALLRAEVRGVIKDRAGMLHMIDTIPSDEILLEYVENLSSLYEAIRKRNIPFLYVQAPSDILEGHTHLPYGFENISNGRIDLFLKMLAEHAIPVWDSREYFRSWPARDVFYATDHHWTTKASFSVAAQIVLELNRRYSLGIDSGGRVADKKNYRTLSYPRSFLGSRGIRVGKFYAGIDDFEYYEPLFSTELALQYVRDGSLIFDSKGNFRKALINTQCLVPSYKNKYNTFLYAGTNEGRVTNFLKAKGKTCLIIGDSFMRSVVPYLSLCFQQTAFLDPQEGRYRKNYIDYIDAYQPDIVVVLFNGLTVYTDIPASDTVSYVQDNAGELYQSLLSTLVDMSNQSSIEQSFYELFKQQGSHQEISKILVSEIRRYRATGDQQSRLLIHVALDWLLGNAYFALDGTPGYGLSYQWDAFGDGSINSAQTSYGIQVANVVCSLLYSLEANLATPKQTREIKSYLRKIVNKWCSSFWTQEALGGYFWYSDRDADNIECANISVELAGVFAKVLAQCGDIFSLQERKTIERHIKETIRRIVALAEPQADGGCIWRYIQKRPNRYNDAVHQGFILEGLENYRSNYGEINVTSILKAGRLDLQNCWNSAYKKLWMYSPLVSQKMGYQLIPGSLFDIGQSMEYFSLSGNKVLALQILVSAYSSYGEWPDILTYPAGDSRATRNARQKSFLLSGLAAYLYD